MIGRQWLVAGVMAAVMTPVTAGDARADGAQVLARHCAGCHGGPAAGSDAGRGGFDAVTNVARMIELALLVPGDPEASEVYQRVRDGEMPPAAVTARPSPAELEVLRAWIAAGAPTPGVELSPPSHAEIEAAALADARRLAPAARQRARFVSLVVADHDQRALLGRAVPKLLNSVSWRPRLHRPVAVSEVLLRIDLDALGWTDEDWEWLARRSPAAWAGTGATARALQVACGTLAPILPGDWLVAEVSGPEAYHRLLGLPSTVEVLERRLGVRSTQVVRAGFNRSGVSLHNRLVERRTLAAPDGYYWRSYDFSASNGRRNLFEHPEARDPDGGEVIFSLPNGLQAYFLIDAAGRRIDRASQDIVIDPGRADRAVRNGVSCMGCHAQGIISRGDELRAHVLRNAETLQRRDRAVVGRVLAEHPPPAVLEEIYARDRARFQAALTALGVDGAREPIDAVAQRYDGALDLEAAAAGLGLPAARFRRYLERTTVPQLAALRLTGGTIKRDAWDELVARLGTAVGRGRPMAEVRAHERLELRCEGGTGPECYRLADRFLHGHGVPANLTTASRLYERACEAGVAAGCTAVGLLASRTGDRRAVAMFRRGCAGDHLRGCEQLGVALGSRGPEARTAFARGCAAGRAESCTRLGDVHYRGAGVRRDLAEALANYQRGCDRGAARACAHAGFMLERGLGVRAEPFHAAAYTARACELGRVSSCSRAGDLAADGRAVRRDHRLAARYRQRACEGGDAPACRSLAVQYRWGQGVEPDWIRSERLFRRACSLGEQRACVYL
ncbi:MAG TPA: c-type cytochrome domain-containing protein [Kofleriaceae bacterium]|nr:c-type cytochrome domain-containing protein [Kofleriaceae bacterium]